MAVFRRHVERMGIEDVVTAPHAPWQNSYMERFIGSIRRECLNHTLILNENHVRRVVASYVRCYLHSLAPPVSGSKRALSHKSRTAGRWKSRCRARSRRPAPPLYARGVIPRKHFLVGDFSLAEHGEPLPEISKSWHNGKNPFPNACRQSRGSPVRYANPPQCPSRTVFADVATVSE